MALLVSAHGCALGAVLAAISLSSAAMADPVLATAEITDGSLGNVGERYSDGPAPAVRISEFATVHNQGTILGMVGVGGTSGGFFSLNAIGQSVHANESTFRFTETVTNTSAFAQSISLGFLIDAGKLMTKAAEMPPGVGEVLKAGYDITMKFADTIVFHSGAVLSLLAGTRPDSSSAQLALIGKSLGGLMKQPVSGASGKAELKWNRYDGNVVLGTLAPGTSALFEYDVRTFVSSNFSSCGDVNCGNTHAGIGDPLKFAKNPTSGSSIGGELTSYTFTLGTSNATPVPEPGSLGLLIAGLIGIGALRRKPVV